MPKKRRPNRQRTMDSPSLQKEARGGFGFGWLVLMFLVGVGFGAIAGYQAAHVLEGGAAADTALFDLHGRTPGHPHYRHDHP